MDTYNTYSFKLIDENNKMKSKLIKDCNRLEMKKKEKPV